MKAVLWTTAVVVAAAFVAWLWLGGPQTQTVTVRTAQHEVTLTTVADPKPGANTFDFDIADRSGEPPAVDTVAVDLVMPQMGHALPPVNVARTEPGHYRATDLAIPMSGQWQVIVSLPGAEAAVLPLLVNE